MFLLLCTLLFAQDDTLWSLIGASEEESNTERPPTTEELLSLFDTKKLSIPMSYEERVVTWVNKLKGSHQKTFQAWTRRSGRYRSEILRLLQKNNLPTELMYLAMIESGFQPQATSSAQAAGIWQFIPSTGKEHGLRIDGVIDERRDPIRSTEAAISYLSDLKLKLGYWHLAMAAYNAGEGLVQSAILKHNAADYWYLCAQKALPEETCDYVPRILAAALVSKDPKLFGVRLARYDAPQELIRIAFIPKKSISLATIVERTEIELETFQNYNPHIIASYIPRAKEAVYIYLPPPVAQKFRSNIIRPQQERENLGQSWLDGNKNDIARHKQRYIVQEGDSISSIALQFSISEDDLRIWNQLKDSIDVGAQLRLLPPPQKKTWFPITVGRSDTLKTLAKKYDCSVDDIKKWNALTEDKVPTGMRLFIKAAK